MRDSKKQMSKGAEEKRFMVAEKEVFCPNCGRMNPPPTNFCLRCGSPCGAYATWTPLERVYAVGWLFRKAVSEPIKPITVLGMWLVTAPTLLWAPVYMKSFLFRHSPVANVLVTLIVIITILLPIRVTMNFIRRKGTGEIDLDVDSPSEDPRRFGDDNA